MCYAIIYMFNTREFYTKATTKNGQQAAILLREGDYDDAYITTR